MMRWLALFLTLSWTGPLAAAPFVAEGGIEVTPLERGFSVAEDGGMGARGYWCAAADFAISRLGANGTERLYVLEPRQGRASPVVFTLSPQGLTPARVFVTRNSVTVQGATLTVSHARSFCHDFRIINR